MEKHIVFVMTPFVSHLIPTYKLAGHFKKAGYQVIYVSTIKFENEITSRGFTFQNSSVTASDNSFLKVERLIPFIISKYNPVVCLIELSFWNWALFLLGMEQKFMMIQTWPCCNKAPYMLPEGYRSVKNRNVLSYVKNELAWIKQNKQNDKLFSHGELSSYYKNIVEMAGLDPTKKYISKRDRIGYFKILNVTELILSPIEFDFPRSKNSFTKFIGPFIDTSRKELLFDWSKVNIANRPIVFCSMGSLTSIFKKRNLFYQRMIDAFSLKKDIILIMSIGNGNRGFDEIVLPENIHVCEYAPQLEMLGKASVFITHGGAGSIKESIRYGVPMLVYPWQSRSDMYGNADRIVYHNLGIMGNIEHDSPQDILKQIELIQKDLTIKEAILKMQSTFKRYEENEMDEVNFILQN